MSIEKSVTKEFICNLWELRKLDRPGYQFISDFMGSKLNPRKFSYLDQFQDPKAMLETQLAVIKDHEGSKDDYVPMLLPYLGTGVIASAFGCEIVWRENENPWTKPIIYSPQEVYKLKSPKVTDGLLGKVLEYTKYFEEDTQGEIPIQVTDVQSPLDIASLIWAYDDFLVAMYTNPKEVHYLLKLVTDLIIEFVKVQKQMLTDFVPSHHLWMPDGGGFRINEDLLAIVSPSLYKEFALPYNNRISEEFNGLFIHSCGDFSFNFENLLKYDKLRGIDFSVTECPLDKVIEVFGGMTLLSTHVGLNKNLRFLNSADYVKYVLDRWNPDIPLYIFIDSAIFNPGTGQYEDNELDPIIDILCERGMLREESR